MGTVIVYVTHKNCSIKQFVSILSLKPNKTCIRDECLYHCYLMRGFVIICEDHSVIHSQYYYRFVEHYTRIILTLLSI